ncbi:MAG: eukaryotic-like serine/threonine-protein kinase [Streptosporangiaceae bacterium]|jgi:serine/threonine protein kinase|nr:serine/threonine protein kinase [Streptosporangiaceae bacterium]MDX6432640.1 eukaryotic-like serine/threonine-protein kinase [Streptosporangiaceae bacterium]
MTQQSDVLIAGRYRLVTELGSGAMGTVWRAHDERLDRTVAIKELRPPPDLNDEERAVFYRRTLREARTPAQLSHASIIDVYDVVVERGCPWIVMELVEAPNLDQLIAKEGPLPPAKVADIARQLLDALSTAHNAGILHRDIKPSNVLLSDNGRVVLTDFGLAITDRSARITRSDSFMGSPAYVAPEVARGEKATPQSDLWSLGATLYTAVEGRPPYDHPNVMATLSAVLTEDPAPLQRAGELAPVINGLLQKNPLRRMTHARVLDRLDRAVAGPRTQRQRQRDGNPRRRLMVALALIAATCATCGIGAGAMAVGMTHDSPKQPAGASPSESSHSAKGPPSGAAANALVVQATGDNCKVYLGIPGNAEVLYNGVLPKGQGLQYDLNTLTAVFEDPSSCRVWINGKEQAAGRPNVRQEYTVQKGG